MKTMHIENTPLFGELPSSEKITLPKTPLQKLSSQLSRDLNDSVERFKIKFNRVNFGKVKKFPIGISKREWIDTAKQVWANKQITQTVYPFQKVYLSDKVTLIDKAKANQ